MKLRDLEGRLIRMEGVIHGYKVETVAEASGVDFVCPICHDGHHIRVYFSNRQVHPALKPLPRWDASGSCLDDLTITPSIHVNAETPKPEAPLPDVCRWHGNVTNGDAK